MEKSELKELITYIDQSSIRELQMETSDYKLYINKNKISIDGKSSPSLANQEPMTPQPEVTNTLESSLTDNSLTKETQGEVIPSPLVGIVYSSSSPTKEPFKKIGDVVEVGETVCIVESMKIMNDIPSPVSGTITNILFENEEVVEFGQPLFEIEIN